MYGSTYLLLLNFVLFPIILRNKEDFLTPILAVAAALLSFVYISSTLPEFIDDKSETIIITWGDNAKIDGGSIKGFAKATSGMTIYAMYKFKSAEEKESFISLNLPSVSYTVSGSFQPADIPSHPYAFNMNNYMSMYGASGIFEVENILHVEKRDTILARLAGQRQNIKQHIHKTFPKSLITEAEALLIGDRSNMSEEDATNYRRLGITHLFAISGLHIGLLTFMLRELLLRLNVRRETVNILLIVLLPVYAIIAGGAPSVWRAVSVTIIVLVTVFGRVNIRLDDALALSAIGFIVYKPFLLFQAGFQLSYIAALSLVLSSKILARGTSALAVSFLVTMISQLSLYPILLFHFHELSLSSFLVNVIYVPLYSVVILPANIIFLLLTFFAMPVAEILFFYYVPFRELIQQITGWISALPYQLWTPGKPGAFEIVCAVIGVLCFFTFYEERKLIHRYLPFVIIPAILIHLVPYIDSSLRVTYLDVGQGDSAVIELPYRRGVYVIDTGGTVMFGEENWKTPSNSFEVGRKIVVPFLKGRGITKIDKLMITHAHADHMEGADEVVEEISVGEIHIAPNSGVEEEMKDLIRVATEKNVPILEMEDGVSWREGQTSFMYMGPQDRKYVGNNSSLVLLMKTTGPSFLFTGDMEEEAEMKFLRKYGEVDFGEIILKVGHHGSKTSSTEPFIKALRPKIAVVSAGRNNRYGHPSPEVLDLFAEYQIPVFVTADNGSVTITIKEESYSASVMEK